MRTSRSPCANSAGYLLPLEKPIAIDWATRYRFWDQTPGPLQDAFLPPLENERTKSFMRLRDSAKWRRANRFAEYRLFERQ